MIERAMKKMTFYIHPGEGHENKQHRVSYISKTGRKRKPYNRWHAFWLDEPGSYHESAWNVHFDGCDYEFDTEQAALDYMREQAAEFNYNHETSKYERPDEVEFIRVAYPLVEGTCEIANEIV